MLKQFLQQKNLSIYKLAGISGIPCRYERKIELFRAFQLGEDLHKIKLAVKDYRKPTIDTEEFVIKNEA